VIALPAQGIEAGAAGFAEMIQGLGADMSGWTLQRLAFFPRYRTIALDNRGAGRSDKPFGRYRLEDMADDAVAVLDAAGVDRAHVMGAPMGAPSRSSCPAAPRTVQSLIPACTACSNHQWRRSC
jgi:3-oxoadipate enol-lactonase